jgi:hypothetical protein
VTALTLSNGINSGKVEMYAPNPFESGSSVSHFSQDATPNEVMEPSYTQFLITPGLATQLLQDMGWEILSTNNAPVFTSTTSLSTLVSNSLAHSLTATDADLNALSFSLVSFNGAQVTASLLGSVLTLQATNNFTGNTSIEVRVLDGITSALQTINLTVYADLSLASDDGNLTEGTPLNISASTFNFTLGGGDSNYTVGVMFDGQGVANELLTFSAGKYSLATPESGAFAGDYTITITDGKGENSSFVVQRPLKVTANVNQLISTSTLQELYIEGASVGSVLDLHINQGDSLFDLKIDDAIITQVVAPDNANSFNRAVVNLDVNSSSQSSAINISADSASLPAGSVDLVTLPFHEVALTVNDSSGNGVSSSIIINDERFTIWGLDSQKVTSKTGKLVLALPTDQSTSVLVTAEDYQTQTIDIDTQSDQATLVLEFLGQTECETWWSCGSSSSGGNGHMLFLCLLLLANCRKLKKC